MTDHLMPWELRRRYGWVVHTKSSVRRRLEMVQLRIGDSPDKRLEIAHLQSALDNWIDGKNEYCQLW